MSSTNIASPSPAIDVSETQLDRKLVSIALVVVLGSVMSTLDLTIVNVAINTLLHEFRSSLATIQWVATGYMLALATVVPLTGWAADRFGTKRVYMSAIALFLVGSMLSGMAWSAPSLIAFRGLQGLGGGMIMPVGMTILAHAAGPKRLGRAMGIVGVPMVLGPIVGPILGGYFVDMLSWRWIFFVNVPVGGAALLLATRFLQAHASQAQHELDRRGFLLLSPGLVLFVYGVASTLSGDAGGRWVAVTSVVTGIALVVGFIFHARNRQGALIDVRLFMRPTIAAAAITVFLFGSVFFGVAFLMPLYFQLVRGESAVRAGLLLSSQGVGAMITMPIGGKLTDKLGPGKVVMTGVALFALGALGLSRLGSATPFLQVEAALFMTGLGAGATLMPAMSGALQTLARGEVARVNSGLNVLLRVGGSLGTAFLAVILLVRVSSSLEAIGIAKGGLAALRGLPPGARSVVLPKVADAFAHAFFWSFGVVIVAFVAALFLPRRKFGTLSQRGTNVVSQE